MKLINVVICICLVARASSAESNPESDNVPRKNTTTTTTENPSTTLETLEYISTASSTTLNENNTTTSATLETLEYISTASSTTLNENNTTTSDFPDSTSPRVSSTDDSTTHDHESTSNADIETDTNDTIIVFSTTAGYNTTYNDISTTTTTVTIVTTVTDEDVSEINDSACFDNSCKNEGVCKESASVPYFTCECAAGYVGIRCETTDRCVYEEDGQPCKKGFCSYSKNGLERFCDCFVGDYWDDVTNECREIKTVCDTNPCENDGHCNLLPGNKYNCTCDTGFSGKSCEITDRCATDKDCGHGSCRLSSDKKTRSCKCDDGFVVQEKPHTCKVVTTPCDLRPCHNNGVCKVFENKTYNCTCEKGFSGKACEIVDRCVTDEDCGHGVCTLSEKKKIRSCKCSDGYYLEKRSQTCKSISSVCQPNPCMHEGICTVLSTNEYNCTCSDGYTGQTCDVRDICIMDGGNAYCTHATCQNNYELGIYYCTCSEEEYFQYTDRKCVKADLCPLMHCELNEKCLNGNCICKENYEFKNSTGKCEPNFCSKKPCPARDMICKEGTDETDFKCSCREGYTFNGTHCNEALCLFPQLNNCEQRCKVTDTGYECKCDEDFKLRNDNKTCELKGNNTCQVKVCNKGSCVLKSGVEVCICPPGYIEVDGNCTDLCTAAKIARGICPDECELTSEGGFRCKCEGKFVHSEDKTTCVVRNMCQENEIGWKKCGERNAECVQNWNETEGYKCTCRKGQVATGDGTCRDVCSLEINQRTCSMKGGSCEVDGKGNATCRCPPYFELNEKDGKCNKPADVSYLVTLPLDLPTYAGGNRKRRSLDTAVDYRKILRDVEITIEEMFVGYKRSNILYCNSTMDYLLCKIELQFQNEHEPQLKRLRTEDICLTDEDTKKCLLPPALVLAKDRISEDVIIEPTDPCEPFIKEENCGSETACSSSLDSKSFNCTCKTGFSMRKRDSDFGISSYVELCRDVDECIENPCPPNSKCVNTIGSFTCTCLSGFRRAQVESSSYELTCVEICRPNPCTHGLCSRRGDHDFDCKCDAGFRGAFCDLQDENFKRERNNSIIVGVVLGGILLITLILFAVCVSRLRKRKCMENPDHMFYGSTEMSERGRINNAFRRE